MGFARFIGEPSEAVFLESVSPKSDDLGRGVELSGGRLDTVLEALLDHLITPMFLVFTLSHNLIIWVWTHKFFGLLSPWQD